MRLLICKSTAVGALLLVAAAGLAQGQNQLQLSGHPPRQWAEPQPSCPVDIVPPSTPSGTATPPQATTPSMDELAAERSAALGDESMAFAAPNMIGDLLVPSGGGRRLRGSLSNGSTLPGVGGVGVLGFNGGGGIGGATGGFGGATGGFGGALGGATGGFGGGALGGGGGIGGGTGGSAPSSSSVVQDGRIPSASHTFKISDNNSPVAQDRLFLSYSYYNDVGAGLNRSLGLTGTADVHREVFGFEKAFLNGNASIGMSLPLLTLADGIGDTINTNIGNLTIIGKWIFARESETGSAATTGLAVTVPTGPNGFAGADTTDSLNEVLLQPYVAVLLRHGNLYFHGFSAIDIPTNSRDVTLWFNDMGIGYFLLNDHSGERFLSALAPTVELHVNTPLNHRGSNHFDDVAATPDWIDVTAGATFEFRRCATLAIGVGVPVTGPLPYVVEGIAQFNWRF